VIGPGKPLRKADDLFQARLTRSDRKRRPTLDDEGMIGRTVVRSLHAAHGVHQLAGIENVRNHDLGAARLQSCAALVENANHRTHWDPFSEKLSDYRATGFSGRACYQNSWINHGLAFQLTVRYRTRDKGMVRIRTEVK
jgi:hypothetical protein